jgi:hypothetical protein
MFESVPGAGGDFEMKRSRGRARLVVALAIGALACAVGAAAAAGGTTGNAATGSAENQFPTPAGPGSAQLSVAAASDPSGLHPTGTVHASGTTGLPGGDFDVAGPVTCLRVDGNKAAIKYRFSQASGSAAPFLGGGVEVFVEDNGQPQGGQAVDANANRPPQPAGVFDATAALCDDPNSGTYDTVTSGDYTVRGGSVGP